MSQNHEEQPLIESDFFKGLSRQPQILGVNMTPAVINFMLWVIFFIGSGKLFFLLLLPVFHGIFALLSSSNPSFFTDIWIYVNTLFFSETATEHNGEITLHSGTQKRFDH